jgi:hypothetical protein
MSQEQKVTDAIVQKLLMDTTSDFKLHAAYLQYTQAWDKASIEDKNELNNVMLSLHKGEIDYQNFYGRMNRFRKNVDNGLVPSRGRTRIETQRKRDYRKKQQKNIRNLRHRK